MLFINLYKSFHDFRYINKGVAIYVLLIMETQQSFVVYLSTYPSRKCGIATFTQDLSTAIDKIASPKLKSKIIALNDNRSSYDYSNDVVFQINDTNIQDYLEAAKKINEDDKIKLVNVQHEFKIFGSDYGENLLVFLEAVKKPVITTLHTVLPAPSRQRKKIIQSIAKNSECLIVMSQFAVEILREDYNLKDSKIIFIPHGVHDVPYEQNTYLKKSLGYADKQLITSFGLLRPGRGKRSSGRGFEYVLDALPDIIKQFPNVLYLIIGITHPKTLKREGEKYRYFLENKVKELGIEKNVKFINRYVTLKELIKVLQTTDIYISSSHNPHQIVSGTLAYAMGCGRAVVSTPFLHAKEAVTPERGIVIDDFKNPKLFSEAIIEILSNPKRRERMGKKAYKYTRHMVWSNVAKSYMDVFNKYLG